MHDWLAVTQLWPCLPQVDPAGNWIEVENTGRKEESIGGWKIGRKVSRIFWHLWNMLPKSKLIGPVMEPATVGQYH